MAYTVGVEVLLSTGSDGIVGLDRMFDTGNRCSTCIVEINELIGNSGSRPTDACLDGISLSILEVSDSILTVRHWT